jgi:hypothetical protein
MPNHAPFIYIIGPLHGESDDEVQSNIDVAEEIAFDIQCAAHELRMPVVTFCPHSETGEHLLDCRNDEVKDNEHLYMRAYLSLLMSGKVDAVYFIGSSPGADVELMIAENMGIRVMRDMDDVGLFLTEWRDS